MPSRSCSSEPSWALSGMPGLPRVMFRAREASERRLGCEGDSTAEPGTARGGESAVAGWSSALCLDPSPEESAVCTLSDLPAAFCSVCCVSTPL